MNNDIAQSKDDLPASLAILSVVICFALIGLAFDHNWPKLVRVALAFLTYASVLSAFARSANARPQYRWFVLAATAAGIVSGVARTVFSWQILVAGAIGAPLFIGGVHYLALRYWRVVREQIEH
jgi:hypothetical protein